MIFLGNFYRFTEDRVPFVVAQRPRQSIGKRGKEEPQGPSNYNIVVKIYIKSYQNHGVANT